MKALTEKNMPGLAFCPICTHTVPATVDVFGKGNKQAKVAPGQRCPRCSASLDVAMVVQIAEAA